jgi:hypothetical protein
MGPVARRATRWGASLLVAAGLCLPATGRGDEPELPDSAQFTPAHAAGDTLPAVAEPFKAGESLRFSVQYGFIHAGTAWL